MTLCLLVVIVVGLTIYLDYRTHHPPTTYSEKNECTLEGLIFHWKFDQLDDGLAVDTSGNEYDGVTQYYFNTGFLSDLLYGQPKSVEGKVDSALQFNGKQWISGGNRSCFEVDKFTISLWVYQENDSIEMPTIMAKSSWWGKKDGFDGWWLCTTTKDQTLQMGISWGVGTAHIDSGYRLPLKEWHHIAVSMDNSNHEVQFYVDGKPYGKHHTHVPKWLTNWNHDLYAAGYDGSGRWSWPGRLDDIQFYSGILPAETILSIHAKGSSDSRGTRKAVL